MVEQSVSTRSAISLLMGLRTKFAKEIKNKITYSAEDLFRMLSEAMQKVKLEEIEEYRKNEKFIENNEIRNEDDEIWDNIKGNIERSKIKRYKWNKIIGISLTQEILIAKRQGLDVDEAYEKICKHEGVKKFLLDFPDEKEKLFENLEISVHARYGENNTESKIMGVKNGKETKNST